MNRSSNHSETDRAVSPVIGVILLVAVTIILAAVISTFVLGLGEDLWADEAPAPVMGLDAQVSEDFEYENGLLVVVSHNTGDTVETDDMTVYLRDQNRIAVSNFSSHNEWSDDVNDGAPELTVTLGGSDPAGESFGPGDRLLIEVTANGDQLPDEVDENTEYGIEIEYDEADATVAQTSFVMPSDDE